MADCGYAAMAASNALRVVGDVQAYSGMAMAPRDRIEPSGICAHSGLKGDQAFTWRGNQAFDGLGQLRFAKGVLEANLTATTGADLRIQLTGVMSLDLTSDIVL